VKLHEAYNVVRGAVGNVSAAELAQASQMVYAQIKDQAKRLPDWCRDDAVQDVFLALHQRGTPLREANEGAARGLIGRALKNEQYSKRRKEKRRREVANKARARSSDANQRQWGDLASVEPGNNAGDWYDLDEIRRHSMLLRDAESPVEVRGRLLDFLRETVLAEAIKRRPARASAREYIDQMQAIVGNELAFDDLVDEEVEPEASKKERKDARDRIHQRHKRTRDRISEWIDSVGVQSVVDKPEEEEGQLSEFDLRLLRLTVLSLRSRDVSGE
jgi:hypothetical protein